MNPARSLDSYSGYSHTKRAALAPINHGSGMLQRFVFASLKNTVKNLNEKGRRTTEEDETAQFPSENEAPSNRIPHTESGASASSSSSALSVAPSRLYRTPSGSDIDALSVRFDEATQLRRMFLTRPSCISEATMSNLPENILNRIFSNLGFEQHLKVRLVCKQWHRLSSKLGMDPVDEVSQMFDVMQVVEYAQDIMKNCLEREAELWSTRNAAHMQAAIAGQREVSTEMRRVLVDWLIEVHFKFRLKPQTLYTAISLVNRVLCNVQVARRELQTIGVSSIMVAAKFEERFAPAINDLVYITSNSSSKQKIVGMEAEILRIINYELTLPSAWSFINRFAKIVGLTKDETLMAMYLVDLTLPEAQFVHVRPSLIVIAAMYLLRQLQHLEPWHDRTAFYTGYKESEVKEMAAEMLQSAKHSKSTSVPKKYKTSTYGGVSSAIQELLASVSDVMAM